LRNTTVKPWRVGRLRELVRVRIGSSMVVAILALLLCASGAFASVMGGSDWLFNWDGTIDYASDWDTSAAGDDGGRHLDVTWNDTTHVKTSAADWKKDGRPIPSPGGYSTSYEDDGEYWDVEYLAMAQTSSTYYFMAILSASPNLVSWGTTYAIGVGDLAINLVNNGTSVSNQTFTAAYGVKLAGTNTGKAKSNVAFGWGITGNYGTSTAELRNPASFSGTSKQASGFYPGQDGPTGDGITYADPYDMASNFTYNDGDAADTVSVVWHGIFGATVSKTGNVWTAMNAGGVNTDGPAGTSVGSGYDGLDTFAVEVAIPKANLGSVAVDNFSLASTCLNDGWRIEGLGGGPPEVPELPPTLLAVMIPAIGLLFRRARSR